MVGQLIDHINALPERTLLRELRHCCAAKRWLDTMTAARPYADVDAFVRLADATMQTLTDDDLMEAYAASIDRELYDGDEGTRSATRVALELFLETFGYPFVISSDTLSTEELLMRVRIRLGLEPAAQLRASRAEQIRLTRARLQQFIERSAS